MEATKKSVTKTVRGDSYGNFDVDQNEYGEESEVIQCKENSDEDGSNDEADRCKSENQPAGMAQHEYQCNITSNDGDNAVPNEKEDNDDEIELDSCNENRNEDEYFNKIAETFSDVEAEESCLTVQYSARKKNVDTEADFEQLSTPKECNDTKGSNNNTSGVELNMEVNENRNLDQIRQTTPIPSSFKMQIPQERLSIHITQSEDDSEETGHTGSGRSYEGDDTSSQHDTQTERTTARSRRRPLTTSTLCEVPGGLRAKANTPASLYTNRNEIESPATEQAMNSGRPASRGSRDEVFQRAMTLMSNRCCSARGEGVALYSDREPPFGVHIPQYFYVQQIRPAPMAPLKVWRGYKGNVYFEPMTINGVHKESAESSESAENQVLCVDGKRRSTPSSNIPTSKRATTAGTSNKSYRYINSSPQVFVMDKQAVIKSINSNTNQELKFIEGTESTGSLAVRPASSGTYGGGLRNRSSNKRVLPKRDRIYRGSNFHSTNGNVGSSSALARSDTDTSRRSFQVCSKSANRKQYSRSAGPMSRLRALQSNSHVDLFVSGGKFSPPTVMSPLLRTTAQFAIGSGSHCLSMDSHENIHDYESLPPLDQVRVSLGHIELEADNPTCLYSGRSDYENTPKPFTEYSPRVTAQ